MKRRLKVNSYKPDVAASILIQREGKLYLNIFIETTETLIIREDRTSSVVKNFATLH